VISQRSRFCLVRAFREPFPDRRRRATAGGGAGARRVDARLRDLEVTDLKDKTSGCFRRPESAPRRRLAFGIGMTLAGGCGGRLALAGGRGQLKLWVASPALRSARRFVRLAMTQAGLLRSWGRPCSAGLARLGGRHRVIVAIALGWAMLATWNEATGRLSGG